MDPTERVEEGTTQLYFLPDDLREQHDRAAEEPERVAELRTKFEARFLKHATASPTGEAPQLPPELEAALEALGYASGGGEPTSDDSPE